jgi:hypothetical protein
MSRLEHGLDDEDVMLVSYDEPNEARYGIYHPSQRLLGSMAASAAAGELVRKLDVLVAPGDRPEPKRPASHDDDWPEGSPIPLG